MMSGAGSENNKKRFGPVASWLPGVLFVVYLALISAPNIWFLFWHPAFDDASRDAQAVFSATMILVFVTALIGRLGWVCWLLLPFAIVMPAELLYMVAYGIPSSPHVIALVRETNVGEASDFLGGDALILAAVVLVNIVVCVAICIALTRWKTTWLWAQRSRRRVLLATALGLAFTLTSLGNPPRPFLLPFLWDVVGFDLQPASITLLRDTYPFGLPQRVQEYFRQAARLQDDMAKLKDYRFHAQQEAVPAQRQVYVLVIGETGRRDRWQLNGYTRPTNPKLSQVPNLVDFNNMLSIAFATRLSVPTMLTRKPAQQVTVFSFDQRSVISAFREAGFSTYFLSTQLPMGLYDNLVAVYANEAQHVGYYNVGNFDRSATYDMALVPVLKAVLAKNEPRQLIVLHTLGSHPNYSNRYPADFDVYKPSLKGFPQASLFDPSQKVRFGNAYDDSILYTDYFLSQVINTVDAAQAQSTLVYAADHGEDLYDGSCKVAGHGYPNRKEYEIAAFAWYSDAYAKAWPDKVAALRANAARPLNLENIFYSLLDAAHIGYDGERDDMSFFNAGLKDHTRLVLTRKGSNIGTTDFDKARFVGECATVVAGTGR